MDVVYQREGSSVAEIESSAILKWFEWACHKGIRCLVVQSDSKEVVDWIKESFSPLGHLSEIILEVAR